MVDNPQARIFTVVGSADVVVNKVHAAKLVLLGNLFNPPSIDLPLVAYLPIRKILSFAADALLVGCHVFLYSRIISIFTMDYFKYLNFNFLINCSVF